MLVERIHSAIDTRTSVLLFALARASRPADITILSVTGLEAYFWNVRRRPADLRCSGVASIAEGFQNSASGARQHLGVTLAVLTLAAILNVHR